MLSNRVLILSTVISISFLHAVLQHGDSVVILEKHKNYIIQTMGTGRGDDGRPLQDFLGPISRSPMNPEITPTALCAVPGTPTPRP